MISRDLTILRGRPCWRRTAILLAYVQTGVTLCVDFDLVVIDHVGVSDFVLVNLMSLGIAAAAAIAGRGFYPVPKWTDVPPPTKGEDRITAERAAWRSKFSA